MLRASRRSFSTTIISELPLKEHSFCPQLLPIWVDTTSCDILSSWIRRCSFTSLANQETLSNNGVTSLQFGRIVRWMSVEVQHDIISQKKWSLPLFQCLRDPFEEQSNDIFFLDVGRMNYETIEGGLIIDFSQHTTGYTNPQWHYDSFTRVKMTSNVLTELSDSSLNNIHLADFP